MIRPAALVALALLSGCAGLSVDPIADAPVTEEFAAEGYGIGDGFIIFHHRAHDANGRLALCGAATYGVGDMVDNDRFIRKFLQLSSLVVDGAARITDWERNFTTLKTADPKTVPPVARCYVTEAPWVGNARSRVNIPDEVWVHD